jgi:hypothetical protein
MNRSDCHIAIFPPLPLRLVGSFTIGNDMAIPSSAVNHRMTRHGLRPRPAANTLALYRVQRYWLPSGETLGPMQQDIFRG